MDTASILLALAVVGQAGWAPGGSTAPPPASAPTYDRYAQPPMSGVSPPPTVLDRTRSAISESGTTLRDGFEAGIQAANEQLQGWTDNAGRQLQTTGNNLRGATEQTLGVGSSSAPRVSNPFSAATSSPPAANSRSRTSVAPPPWTDTSAMSAPNWDTQGTESGTSLGQTASPGLRQMRTENGWTSIGSQIAAPRLLVPQLTTPSSTPPLRDAPAGSGPRLAAPAPEREPFHSVLGDSSRQRAPSAAGADSWATGWANNASESKATISRSAADTTHGAAAGESGLVPLQTANPRPQDSPQQPTNNWADLWGEKDPWDEPPQASRSATTGQQAGAASAAATNNPVSQPPLIGVPINNVSPQAAAPGVAQSTANAMAPRLAGPQGPATEQPPWLPLLVVSLSLAGSLGANLFLGWSYMDARQKYRALVRKTADKFRRAATAAA